MSRHYIRRQNFDWVSLDQPTWRMDISFLSGGLHSFSGISQETFDAFLQAESKTDFFLHQIKNRHPLTMSKGKG